MILTQYMALLQRLNVEIGLYDLVEIRQGPQTLSNPILDFRLKVINGDIKHHKNPLLDIAIKNAVAKDTNDSLMIEKKNE